MNNISTLTEDERLLVCIILVGCTKVICNIVNHKAKNLARSLSTQKIKSLYTTAIITNTPLLMKDNPIFSQIDILTKLRTSLPENISPIQSANFQRIRDSAVRINLWKSAENQTIKNSPRGRPGPKSDLITSQYQDNLERVLAKPEVDLVYDLLLNSAMIYRLVKHIELIKFYVMKINDDKEKAWEICKSVISMSAISTKRSSFDDTYENVRLINRGEDLEKRADARAKRSLIGLRPETFLRIYKMGGLCFQA